MSCFCKCHHLQNQFVDVKGKKSQNLNTFGEQSIITSPTNCESLLSRLIYGYKCFENAFQSNFDAGFKQQY